MRSIVSLLSCVLVAACASQSALLPAIDAKLAQAEVQKQHEIFLADYRDHLLRSSTVFANLARANVQTCDRTGPLHTGLFVTTAAAFTNEQRAAARKVFGDPDGNDVDDQPWVFATLKDSPAEKAGLRAGDRIVAIGGTNLPNGLAGQKLLGEQFRAAGQDGPVDLQVRRGGETVAVQLAPEQACDYGFVLQRFERINAFADGGTVTVTTGLMRFVRTDDELALILGHEMAHNVLGHRNKGAVNAATGGILGATGALLATGPIGAAIGVSLAIQGATFGARFNSQDYESEADYVGTYFAAKAGYNVENAADIIRRFAVLDPNAIHLSGGTHPSTALRFLAIEKTAEEIRAKQLAGSPVVPNARD